LKITGRLTYSDGMGGDRFYMVDRIGLLPILDSLVELVDHPDVPSGQDDDGQPIWDAGHRKPVHITIEVD
jgi:hypothetical protein